MHAGCWVFINQLELLEMYFGGRSLGIGSVHTESYLKLLKINTKTLINSTRSSLLSLFLNAGSLVHSTDALGILN